jgi:O-antigen ligase
MIVFARHTVTDVFLWNAVGYAGLMVGAFFFLEFFLTDWGRTGSALNPINSAVFISILVVILAMAPTNENFKPWLFFVSQILCINAIISTGTRSAVIILVPALTVIVYRELRIAGFQGLKFRNLISTVILLISISPLAFLPESRLTTIGSQIEEDRHNSISDRIHLYSHAVSIIPSALPLGVGQSGYNVSLSQYGNLHSLEHLEKYNHPHNEILNYTVKYGVFGVLALLMLYIGPMIIFLRGYGLNSNLSSVGLYVLYVFMGNGTFHSLFSHNSMIMIYVMIVILLSSIINNPRSGLGTLRAL